MSEPKPALPTDPATRKATQIVAGCLDYFPAALAAVAELSRVGNEQHNPGKPMHHNRSKSTDHAECIARHLIDRGTLDTDGIRHSAKVAWRALAMLQIELEREAGAPLPRAAKVEEAPSQPDQRVAVLAHEIRERNFKDQAHPENDGHRDGEGFP